MELEFLPVPIFLVMQPSQGGEGRGGRGELWSPKYQLGEQEASSTTEPVR